MKTLDFIKDLSQELAGLGIILPQELNDPKGWVRAIKKWRKAEINTFIEPCLDYCKKQNGMDCCKNCGLEKL